MTMPMRDSLGTFRKVLFGALLGVLALCQFAVATTNVPVHNDPVADPHAVVTVGNARFTVLAPQLIRLEWAGDRKFEDHASLVFLNRKLPVPQFTHEKL